MGRNPHGGREITVRAAAGGNQLHFLTEAVADVCNPIPQLPCFFRRHHGRTVDFAVYLGSYAVDVGGSGYLPKTVFNALGLGRLCKAHINPGFG